MLADIFNLPVPHGAMSLETDEGGGSLPRLRSIARSCLAAVFAILATLHASPWSTLSAAERPRARVLIWIATPEDRALVERVRGQVSDLELDLEVVEEQPKPDTARRMAAVWFTRPDPNADRVVVHAMDSEHGRTLVRELGDGGPVAGGSLSSGTLEAAALVVREALRAMTAVEPAAADPQKQPEPLPSPRVARQVRMQHAVAERLWFRGEAKWSVTLDDAGPVRRQGPSFQSGIHYRGRELALFAGSSLMVREANAYGAIQLRRQVLGLRGGYEWRGAGGLAFGAGLRAGIAVYARSTESLGASVIPTGDRTSFLPLLGPELRGGWAPGRGSLELLLSAGVDVVPGAPHIGYQVDGHFEPVWVIWHLQPALGLGVAFRTERGH